MSQITMFFFDDIALTINVTFFFRSLVNERFTFQLPLLCQRSKSFCTPYNVYGSKENLR